VKSKPNHGEPKDCGKHELFTVYLFSVRAMNRQLTFVMNFLLTVGCAFAFGYKAAELSLPAPNVPMVRLFSSRCFWNLLLYKNHCFAELLFAFALLLGTFPKNSIVEWVSASVNTVPQNGCSALVRLHNVVRSIGMRDLCLAFTLFFWKRVATKILGARLVGLKSGLSCVYVSPSVTAQSHKD